MYSYLISQLCYNNRCHLQLHTWNVTVGKNIPDLGPRKLSFLDSICFMIFSCLKVSFTRTSSLPCWSNASCSMNLFFVFSMIWSTLVHIICPRHMLLNLSLFARSLRFLSFQRDIVWVLPFPSWVDCIALVTARHFVTAWQYSYYKYVFVFNYSQVNYIIQKRRLVKTSMCFIPILTLI